MPVVRATVAALVSYGMLLVAGRAGAQAID